MYILSQDKTRIYNMSGHIEGIGYEESKDYKQRKSENIRHYKTKQKDVDRIVKGDLNVCDHLMKWYGDKYDFAEAEVKYNTFNGRFYIYGRMRLRKGTAHDKGKK